MPLDPKKRGGLKKIDQDFLRVIDEYGWQVMGVAPRVGEEGELWSYSTGLYYHYKHPEIIIFNQKHDLMHSMINSIGKRVKTGEKFEPGRSYSEIIGDFEYQFRQVDVTHYKEYVGWAIWFYDHDPANFPVLQCFWPDMTGKLPWEPGCAQWTIDYQPLLDRPKVETTDEK